MIFASCVLCGYAMDIFQELPELIAAPLSCPRCGGLDLKLQSADDPEDEAA
jgi:predicted nucleic acid-binding Zn ribbon protein